MASALIIANRVWRRLHHEDCGQDLIEYALVVALITLAAVGAVTQVGDVVTTVFWDVIAAAIPAN